MRSAEIGTDFQDNENLGACTLTRAERVTHLSGSDRALEVNSLSLNEPLCRDFTASVWPWVSSETEPGVIVRYWLKKLSLDSIICFLNAGTDCNIVRMSVGDLKDHWRNTRRIARR